MVATADIIVVAVQTVAPAVLAGMAAWGGINASLNGTKEDVREIKKDIKGMITTQSAHSERLARLEARNDFVDHT